MKKCSSDQIESVKAWDIAGCWVWCWWCISCVWAVPGDCSSPLSVLAGVCMTTVWRLHWVPLSWVITSGAPWLRPLCDTDHWLHNNVILITPLWSPPGLWSQCPHFLHCQNWPRPLPSVIIHALDDSELEIQRYSCVFVVIEWLFCLVYVG